MSQMRSTLSRGPTLLFLCGGTLALFIAAVLCIKPDTHRVERLLILLLFYLALDLLLQGYRSGLLYRSFPHLLCLDRSLPFLYVPFLYFLATAAPLTFARPFHIVVLSSGSAYMKP